MISSCPGLINFYHSEDINRVIFTEFIIMSLILNCKLPTYSVKKKEVDRNVV